MTERTVANGIIRPCCDDEANRELVERLPDRRVERCRVCGRRHFTLFVDPGQLGLEGAHL